MVIAVVFGVRSSHVYGQCELGCSDGPKGWADCGGISHVYGWMDGEDEVGEKAAEECPPDEEWSTTA